MQRLAMAQAQHQRQDFRGAINLWLQPLQNFGLLLQMNLQAKLRIVDECLGRSSRITGSFGLDYK